MIKPNVIPLSDSRAVIWDKPEKLTPEDIEGLVAAYLESPELRVLYTYYRYYEQKNPNTLARWWDKETRGKRPNNYVPTAYYSTVVDTMSGYMFSNIEYNPAEESDADYVEVLNEILDNNETDVKDMRTGVHALAFNKAVELVYSTGDGAKAEIKYATFDPRQWLIVYDEKIDPDVVCGIRVFTSNDTKFDYYVDVIYADEWQYYTMKNDKIAQRKEPRELFFSQCPVIEYRAEVVGNQSPFHVVLTYIDALDYLITGNANEIESLVDAILALGRLLSDEDVEHLDEIRVLTGMKQEDRAEYITKNLDPQFREYVSKLLINEIHKHSHVIDWYSPDTGLSGQVSSKALRTRLFDMDMYSKRIEKVFKKGTMKRLALITELMAKMSQPIGDVEVVFNRVLPSDIEDKLQPLAGAPYLSDQTKIELLGLDWAREKERLEAQAAEFEEIPDDQFLAPPEPEEEPEDMDEEDMVQ